MENLIIWVGSGLFMTMLVIAIGIHSRFTKLEHDIGLLSIGMIIHRHDPDTVKILEKGKELKIYRMKGEGEDVSIN